MGRIDAADDDTAGYPRRASRAESRSSDNAGLFEDRFRYHNGGPSNACEGGLDVIDEKMAERMVACGWIAAIIAGLFMLVLSLMTGLRLAWLNAVVAVALFALAYGIYRRSRVCALIVFINHLLGIASLLRLSQSIPPIEVATTLVLGVLYLLGIVGTFSHHARQRRQAV